MHLNAIYLYFGSEFLRTPMKQRLLQHLFENCDRCKSRLQKAKAVRKWCVKNCLETGNLSMKEKRGSEGDPCFLSWRYWVSAKQGQITWFLVFCCRHKVVTLDFECLKWGILISMSCKLSTPLWIEICSNRKNCCAEPVVFVISPTRKNAQNA